MLCVDLRYHATMRLEFSLNLIEYTALAKNFLKRHSKLSFTTDELNT